MLVKPWTPPKPHLWIPTQPRPRPMLQQKQMSGANAARNCCCVCACPDTPGHDLRIVGYADGDVTVGGCDECDNNAGAAWNGTCTTYLLNTFPSRTCEWQSVPYPIADADYTKSIDGKTFGGAQVLCNGEDNYQLGIFCVRIVGLDVFFENAWVGTGGETASGDEGTGLYARLSGCADGPSTLELEAF